MAELIAKGREADQSRRLELYSGTVVRIGRAPRTGWKIPWDRKISREHAEIHWDGETLSVRRLDAARNPIWFGGMAVTDFEITAGDEFQIGDTVFRLTDGPSSEERDQLIAEHVYDPNDLREHRFGDEDERLEEFARLPELMSKAANDEEFASQIAKLLLRSIPRASATAVIGVSDEEDPLASATDWKMEFDRDEASDGSCLLVRWEQRTVSREQFRPSRRLVRKSMKRGEVVLHVWDENGLHSRESDFTLVGNMDWAFCVPITGESAGGLSLYVSGSFGARMDVEEQAGTPIELLGDLRFACLLASFVSIIRQARQLGDQQAVLSSFFSPAVIEAIRSNRSETLLAPSESDISVLFCDVRGFARKAEADQSNLIALLQRVSEALSVMTRNIVKHEGIVADFQGDAALGFWGWPSSDDVEGPLGACRAALAIHEEFSSQPDEGDGKKTVSVLENFRVGIGIAHGRAVAGKIGADEHVKVGVFGPVVNTGARLEGLTKVLRVSILIDEETAMLVRDRLPASEGRCRKLARVIPFGTITPITVYELLPPVGPQQLISDENIVIYERAVDDFIAGRWQEALDQLDLLPVRDRAKDFLMIHIAQNHYEPPDDWNGVITMSSK
jgi:adenylate cyclase